MNDLTRRSFVTAQRKSDVLCVALTIRPYDCVVVEERFSIFSEPHSLSDCDLDSFVEMMRLTNGGTVFPVAEGMMTVTDTAILSEPVTAATTASANKTWACCLAHTFLL